MLEDLNKLSRCSCESLSCWSSVLLINDSVWLFVGSGCPHDELMKHETVGRFMVLIDLIIGDFTDINEDVMDQKHEQHLFSLTHTRWDHVTPDDPWWPLCAWRCRGHLDAVPAEERHLHVSPEQNLSDGRQLGGTALHLQTLLLNSHLTQVIASPRLWHHTATNKQTNKQTNVRVPGSQHEGWDPKIRRWSMKVNTPITFMQNNSSYQMFWITLRGEM